MKFEWNPEKNEINIRERGLDFADAREMFERNLLVAQDNRKEYGENRFIGVGYIQNRLMVVVFTKRKFNIIRIISLRKANKREQAKFKASIQN